MQTVTAYLRRTSAAHAKHPAEAPYANGQTPTKEAQSEIMPNDLTELLDTITKRLDLFQEFSKTQVQATDTLIAADKLMMADIAQIKRDVALILETLKAGSRH